MPQDQISGARANKWGRETARKIARLNRASQLVESSNEFKLEGKRIVIKCAQRSTSSVGVTYGMLERLDKVLGAFEDKDGRFQLWLLDRSVFREHMRQTGSKGPSSGKVGLVSRKKFEQHGELMKTINLRSP